MAKSYTGFTSHHNVKKVEIVRQPNLTAEDAGVFSRVRIVITSAINHEHEIYSEVTLFGDGENGIEIKFEEEQPRS